MLKILKLLLKRYRFSADLQSVLTLLDGRLPTYPVDLLLGLGLTELGSEATRLKVRFRSRQFGRESNMPSAKPRLFSCLLYTSPSPRD